jgi:hypothetical protein
MKIVKAGFNVFACTLDLGPATCAVLWSPPIIRIHCFVTRKRT